MIQKLLGLPLAGSAHAGQLDTITLLVHVLMFALFFGWGTYFIYALVRFRRRANPRAQYEPVKSRFSTYSEVTIVLAELILLVAFSIPAWATRARDVPPAHEALVVRAVAEQFSWNFHYPGPDGQFGATDPTLMSAENPIGLNTQSPRGRDDVTTINEIVVPVGRPVIVQLSSKDVIHSFGIPVMRVKQDANPGMTTPVWFTPTVAGDFDVACSQLCGMAHYRMRAVLRVVSADQYRTWLGEQRQ